MLLLLKVKYNSEWQLAFHIFILISVINRKLNLGFKEQKITNKKNEIRKKAEERRKQLAERKLLNPELSSQTAGSVRENRSNTASLASQSRRCVV